ncbi:MAG: nitrogenase cofactor biosynthesis protein NifB [Rhizomicrobium sp.]|nr:nitrogenase cofactor biosynthesis protein NifB [Rhizomicrobium sp.]
MTDSNIVPLSSITRVDPAKPRLSGCSAKSNGKATSCGSSAGQDDLPEAVWNKIQDHPCYSEDAHHYFARMHVAVAPACNIQCNYCNRKYDCSNESRPGVVSEKLSAEQAALKVMAVAAEVPQLSVVGIAGPGDALANAPKTFHTFDLIHAALPHVKLCLSTNGLALPDHVEQIAAMGIDHVTITINMVDPEIGAQIYPWIFFRHKRWEGLEAAQILHERQMEGLEALTAKGILVKVNSVLIPGINDQHLVEVNKAVRSRGAFLHNVMPLISDPAHGTHFGLTGQRGPTPNELRAVQDSLGGDAKLMRHCRQCRADAVGLLGEDRGAEFSLDKLTEAKPYDPKKREMYLEVVERERGDRQKAKEMAQMPEKIEETPVLVAIATKGGGRINQHFGHATEFQIFEVTSAGAKFISHRRTDKYCVGGTDNSDAMATTIAALEGVAAVLCAKIGDKPKQRLADMGIIASDQYAFEYIEASAITWYATRNACDVAASA